MNSMKPGDLVVFQPQGKFSLGALTAVKYFQRIKNYTEGKPGVIIADHGNTFSVLFGEKILVINKNHLEKIK